MKDSPTQKSCACSNCPTSFSKEHSDKQTHHHDHSEGHSHSHEHSHDHGGAGQSGILYNVLASVLILLAILGVNYWWSDLITQPWLQLIAYLVAFMPVGIPVILEGIEIYREERTVFNECTLMVIASIGAFVIGEYPEAVILMILYNIGEWLQGLAINNARKSISELVDARTDHVTLIKEDGSTDEIEAVDARPGDRMRLYSGMRVALDGVLLSEDGLLDVSALTGESVPKEISAGDKVLAGSVVISRPVEVEVTKEYKDSTLARILAMAEEAAERKPATERFIRRFAKVYTPIVMVLALLVVSLPWVWSLIQPSYNYIFSDWLYRSLVFLVTSCPCALIISVPLTYFCGIGAASRGGILFKGAIFLEHIKEVTAAIFDKTGTLTEGSFEIKEVLHSPELNEEEAVALIAAVEEQSSHPMALAITNYAKQQGITPSRITEVEEKTGMGLRAESADGSVLLVGSERLMDHAQLLIPEALHPKGASAVLLAKDNKVVATIILRDKVKETSGSTIKMLRKRGVNEVWMLSGDKQEVVTTVGEGLGIDHSYGDLLPDDKMRKVEELMKSHKVLFVGDGLNDAPVMSMADIGIAMGGIGSDATIEAADVVIQGDSPYKVIEAIDIARHTDKIVLQNIIFALGFKFIVMLLATIGIASLTLAIIADVGVTLLVIANALRALGVPKTSQRR